MIFRFELPKLTYDYSALEPFIDAKTMEIHHTKHHDAYVTNLNNALALHHKLHVKTIMEMLANLDEVPEDIRTVVRNNGGGHYNHSLFWAMLTPNAKKEPDGVLLDALKAKYGSFDGFKEVFTKVALGRFGSGWAWVVLDINDELEVKSTPNQDSPVIDHEDVILGLDVWEHAYYLNYQNRRADYVASWWNIINWDKATELYLQAKNTRKKWRHKKEDDRPGSAF
ncbi:MAG: superoxide dismutase [Patescibacteria group bacterium]